MKKLFCIFATLCLFLCMLFSTSMIAHAEEPTVEEPVQETEIEETGLKDEIASLIAKVNSLKEENFFNEKILPILVGAGVGLITILGALIPYLKKNSAFKKVYGVCAGLKDENEELKKLLSSTDIGKIKEALTDLFGENLENRLDEIAKKLKPDKVELAEFISELKILSESIKALIDGATNAWSAKPEAVACLTKAPTKEALKEANEKILLLTNVIKELKGDEAEKLIEEAGVKNEIN